MTIHTHNGGEQHEHGPCGPHHHGDGTLEQTGEIWSPHPLTGPSTVLPLKPDPEPAFAYARAQEIHDSLTARWGTYYGASQPTREGMSWKDEIMAGTAYERRAGDRRSEDRDLLAKIQRLEDAKATWQARGRTSWEATDKGSLARVEESTVRDLTDSELRWLYYHQEQLVASLAREVSAEHNLRIAEQDQR